MTKPKVTEKETPDTEAAEVQVPCEVYSRVVGYLRPVQNWHEGKKQEFSERKTFQVPEEVSAEED